MVKKQKQVIDASGTNFFDYFNELIKYKDLLITLSIRDFKVRYSQTFLGFLWVIIQPLFTILVMVLVFEKTLHVNTFGIPYPLYAMAGMMLWTYFGYVMNQAGTSIVSSQSIISKVYFPRLIIPLSKAVVGLIDLVVSFLILSFLFIIYGFPLSFQCLYGFIFIVLAIFASIGAGILFSSFSVKYRDFQYVIPFILQIGFYITPIAYPATIISPNFKWIYFLNPMAGIIEGLRWSIFNQLLFEPLCLLSFMTTFIMFFAGIYCFIKSESEMADIV